MNKTGFFYIYIYFSTIILRIIAFFSLFVYSLFCNLKKIRYIKNIFVVIYNALSGSFSENEKNNEKV